MSENFRKLWRDVMGVWAAFFLVQFSTVGYLMIKHDAWEMWPLLFFYALCGVYFWIRGQGWLEPSE